MQLTSEQQDIINYALENDGYISVNAVAGAGKTSLLVELTKALKPQRALYLAYNRAIAVEASRKFPKSVTCCTTHSLAFKPTVTANRLSLGKFTYRNINTDIPYERRCELVDIIKEYFLSSYIHFSDFIEQEDIPIIKYEIALLESYISQMESGDMECTHEFYLKYFHILLATGHITYDEFDFLALDEAGDVNPVTLEIVKLLPAKKKILVGDQCLPGKTRVKTSTGWRNISSIVKSISSGDLVDVWSYNHSTSNFEFKPVVAAIKTGTQQCFKLSTTRSAIECTANHKIATPSGYKRLDELSLGDIVLKDGDINLQNTKTLLNPHQYQILLGSFLGDGYIDYQDKHHKVARLRLAHSAKQQGYLSWKASAFNASVQKTSDAKITAIQGSLVNVQAMYSAQSKLFVIPEPVSINLMYQLSPLGLAIWLMDDGSLRNKYSPTDAKLSIAIDTNAFTFEENQILVDVLKVNFNLDATIQKTRNFYRLSFNKTNSLKLLSIVSPYIHDDFIHKFKHEATPEFVLNSTQPTYTVDVITSITPTSITDTFDIEVADNHNFIASATAQLPSACGILVHNCQNIYSFNHTINCFQVMKGQGIEFPMSQSFRVSPEIASRINTFCKAYIDPKMKFIGTPQKDSVINTRAIISRTNTALISKMIELNAARTPYTLTRSADDIFSLPKALCFLKHKGIMPPDYKYIQEDVNDYFENSDIRKEYKTVLSYLKELYKEDVQVGTAISLVLKYKTAGILSCYEEAKKHEKYKTTLYLGTSHSTKGLEFDEVYIMDDLNQTVAKLQYHMGFNDLSYDDLSSDEQSELNLYYVACSRAHKVLLNATQLEYTYTPITQSIRGALFGDLADYADGNVYDDYQPFDFTSNTKGNFRASLVSCM